MSLLVHLIDPQTGFAFLGLAVLSMTCCLGELRRRRRRADDFDRLAREKGLTRFQGRLLMRLARQQRLRRPAALLDSLRAFDACVGRCAARLVEEGDQGKSLQELARIRAALGFDRMGPDQVMRTTHQLERGQRLALWQVGSGSGERGVAVVVARDECGIAAVLLNGKEMPWKAGDEVAVRVRRGRAAEYRFRTRVLETGLQDRSVVLRHAEQVERVQARQLFRWDTSFDIRLFPVAREAYHRQESEGMDLGAVEPVEGVVTNISGGGLSSLVRSRIAAGVLLMVDPYFQGPFPLAGLVCEVVASGSGGRGYRLRLRFVDLPQKAEAAIVRAIYRCQFGKRRLRADLARPT